MTTAVRAPAAGPEVWTGKRWVDDDSWIVRLSDDHIGELETALAGVRTAGLEMRDVGEAEFPLPTLRPVIDRVLDELEHGRGFVLVRGLPVAHLSDDDAAMVYWGIGTHMGTCVTQNAAGDLLGHVYDLGFDFAETNVRGYTTRAFLPFHTDGSDVVGLLCLRSAKSGGASSLASSMVVHNTLLAEAPDLLEELYQVWHFDRRAEVEPGEPPTFTSPIFSECAGRISCRYVPGILRSAPDKLGTELSDPQRAALDLFDDIVARPGIRFDMDFQPGDMQFVNNYSVLHSRTEYEDHAEPEHKRHLLRLWLTIRNGRELAPEFAILRGKHRFG